MIVMADLSNKPGGRGISKTCFGIWTSNVEMIRANSIAYMSCGNLRINGKKMTVKTRVSPRIVILDQNHDPVCPESVLIERKSGILLFNRVIMAARMTNMRKGI